MTSVQAVGATRDAPQATTSSKASVLEASLMPITPEAFESARTTLTAYRGGGYGGGHVGGHGPVFHPGHGGYGPVGRPGHGPIVVYPPPYYPAPYYPAPYYPGPYFPGPYFPRRGPIIVVPQPIPPVGFHLCYPGEEYTAREVRLDAYGRYWCSDF